MIWLLVLNVFEFGLSVMIVQCCLFTPSFCVCNPKFSDCIPSNRAMLLQIIVAMKALPLYALYVTFDEYVVENGWTRCFPRISDVGLQAYLGCVIVYLCVCEFAIYWVHRLLHDIKPLYKYVHAPHHIFNKRNYLSPFAGKCYTLWLADYSFGLRDKVMRIPSHSLGTKGHYSLSYFGSFLSIT